MQESRRVGWDAGLWEVSQVAAWQRRDAGVREWTNNSQDQIVSILISRRNLSVPHMLPDRLNLTSADWLYLSHNENDDSKVTRSCCRSCRHWAYAEHNEHNSALLQIVPLPGKKTKLHDIGVTLNQNWGYHLSLSLSSSLPFPFPSFFLPPSLSPHTHLFHPPFSVISLFTYSSFSPYLITLPIINLVFPFLPSLSHFHPLKSS